jgi:hypothetical protein
MFAGELANTHGAGTRFIDDPQRGDRERRGADRSTGRGLTPSAIRHRQQRKIDDRCCQPQSAQGSNLKM